jgi:hypothetical protein
MKTAAKHVLTREGRPFGCYLEERVRRARSRGVDGAEWPEVERWLDGRRYLGALIVPDPERKP